MLINDLSVSHVFTAIISIFVVFLANRFTVKVKLIDEKIEKDRKLTPLLNSIINRCLMEIIRSDQAKNMERSQLYQDYISLFIQSRDNKKLPALYINNDRLPSLVKISQENPKLLEDSISYLRYLYFYYPNLSNLKKTLENFEKAEIIAL